MDQFVQYHYAPPPCYVALPHHHLPTPNQPYNYQLHPLAFSHTIPNRILVDPSSSYIPISTFNLHPHYQPMICNPSQDSTNLRTEREHSIVSTSGGYVPFYGLHCDSEVSRRDGNFESKKHVKHRKAPRVFHRVSDSDDNNRGKGDSAPEFSCTLNKQVKRKSALLRLQMPKPKRRIGDIEQLHCTDYAADSDVNSFTGKSNAGFLGSEKT